VKLEFPPRYTTRVLGAEPLSLLANRDRIRPLNVVLICHLGRAGYNVLRSLTNIGATVFVIRDNRSESMRYSVRSQVVQVVPHIGEADPEAIADIINHLHCKHGIDSVIGADVESLMLIGRMEARLLCPVFPTSNGKTIERLHDKWSFYQLCRDQDVPVPKTLSFATRSAIEVDLVEAELGWPVIVKPTALYGQRGLSILRNREEFLDWFGGVQADDDGVIVQEYLEGDDWALGIFARNGTVEHWTAWVCPGQLDANYGTGRFLATEFSDRLDLAEMGERIVSATGFSGIANFDARFDRRSNTMRMLECNPRCFNRMLAARANGLDFVIPGLPGYAGTQPQSLGSASFYSWHELFTMRGLRRLGSGEWPLAPFARDLRDMMKDPFVPIMRKLVHEDALD
jgi:biotin carboxylase